MVGLGGIFVEVLGDTAMRLAPIDRAEARAMFEELRGASATAWRTRRAAIDLDALADLLVSLSELAANSARSRRWTSIPWWHTNEGSMLDARVLLAQRQRQPSARSAQSSRTGSRTCKQRIRCPNGRGDRRQAHGRLHVAARDEALHRQTLFGPDRSQRNSRRSRRWASKTRSRWPKSPEPIDYAVSAVPRQVAPRILKDCVDNKVGGIGFFTSGFSETTEELGITARTPIERDRARLRYRAGRSQLHGPLQPRVRAVQLSRPEMSATRGDVCFISQSGTHTINFSVAGAGRAASGQQGRLDRQRADARGRGLSST